MKKESSSIWIIVFAIFVLVFALKSHGQEVASQDTPVGDAVEASDVPMTQVWLNGESHWVERAVEGANHSSTSRHASQPISHVQVSARYEFNDSDADPDGWVAEVRLLDRTGKPTRARASAKFQLSPRVPTHDFIGNVTANVAPLIWTANLDFDERGIATVKLPLKQRINVMFGWRTTTVDGVGTVGRVQSKRRGPVHSSDHRLISRSFVTADQLYRGTESALEMPAWGELRTRVLVPGQNAFDAVCPVRLRPPVLVDTRWPYQ